MATVAPGNAMQARSWDGADGALWAERADGFDRSMAGYHETLMTAAAIGPGERVLDIGCGTGQTTRTAARCSGDGAVLGVDLSAQLLELARRRAAEAGLANASFVQADAQIHPFDDASFDVVISRNGVMFFGDQEEAFTNIGRAVRPGGRLALLVWQAPAHNDWIREILGALAAGRALPPPPAGAPGPFALADPDRIRHLCTQGGFTDVTVSPLSSSMWFGHDAADAEAFTLRLFGGTLEELSDADRSRALAAVRAVMSAHETGDGVFFDSATWLVQAVRSPG